MKSYKNEDELMTILMKPYPADKVRWRVGRSGVKNNKPWAMMLAYVDARDVRHRLDEAFGRLNWKCSYQYEKDTILCHLSAHVLINGEKRHIQGSDGAGESQVEKEKGGISDAFKRASNAAFGVYEYLYDAKDNFAKFHEKGKEKLTIKVDGKNKFFACDFPVIKTEAAKPAPSLKPKKSPKDYALESILKAQSVGELDALVKRFEDSDKLDYDDALKAAVDARKGAL